MRLNEGMAVYLDFAEEGAAQEGAAGREAFISRMDELLLSMGIQYSGFQNVYHPVESASRDHAVFAAVRALHDTAWLKGRLADTPIMHRTNVCSLEQIRLDHMDRPGAAKMRYYESYFRASGSLAHGIVVDERRQLRDGYTSYLLARKYGICPDIYEAFAACPLRKVVRGRHVAPEGGTWKEKGGKRYSWAYPLKKPVVPGDILRVQTKRGQAFIRVDGIDYVTGEEFCGEYLDVIKHMGKYETIYSLKNAGGKSSH